MFHNKRGIELSINFIVMLILAIAVFAGGLMFASKFFGHAEQIRGNLDAQTEKQIEKLLDSGSPVVIPVNTKEIFRNKFDTFGVGVLAQNPGKYTLKVTKGEAFRKDKSTITGSELDLQVPVTEITVDKNEKGKFLVGVEVPKDAEKGTYLFNVVVDYEGNPGATPPIPDKRPYDNPLQFIVKVP